MTKLERLKAELEAANAAYVAVYDAVDVYRDPSYVAALEAYMRAFDAVAAELERGTSA